MQNGVENSRESKRGKHPKNKNGNYSLGVVGERSGRGMCGGYGCFFISIMYELSYFRYIFMRHKVVKLLEQPNS